MFYTVILFAAGKEALLSMFDVSFENDLQVLDEDVNNDDLTASVSSLVPSYKIERGTIKNALAPSSGSDTNENENEIEKTDETNPTSPSTADDTETATPETETSLFEMFSNTLTSFIQKVTGIEDDKVEDEKKTDSTEPTDSTDPTEPTEPTETTTETTETNEEMGRTTDKMKIRLVPNMNVPAIAYCVTHLNTLPNPSTSTPETALEEGSLAPSSNEEEISSTTPSTATDDEEKLASDEEKLEKDINEQSTEDTPTEDTPTPEETPATDDAPEETPKKEDEMA